MLACSVLQSTIQLQPPSICRHKYHEATERYGFNRSLAFFNAFPFESALVCDIANYDRFLNKNGVTLFQTSRS
jgi:hypothetical protein